jgi:hypothetical protein
MTARVEKRRIAAEAAQSEYFLKRFTKLAVASVQKAAFSVDRTGSGTGRIGNGPNETDAV